jgi:hypothetical protein
MILDANLQEGRKGEKRSNIEALSNAICAAEPTLTKSDCTAMAVKVYMACELERWLETALQKRSHRWEQRMEDSCDRFMERALERTRRQR